MAKEKMDKMDKHEKYAPHKDEAVHGRGEKSGKDEIPDISPLASQQPPKDSRESKGSSGEPGKLDGGVMSHVEFQDKMTKSLCK